MSPDAFIWIGNVTDLNDKILLDRLVIRIPLWRHWGYWFIAGKYTWLRRYFTLIWNIEERVGMPRHEIRFIKWHEVIK